MYPFLIVLQSPLNLRSLGANMGLNQKQTCKSVTHRLSSSLPPGIGIHDLAQESEEAQTIILGN